MALAAQIQNLEPVPVPPTPTFIRQAPSFGGAGPSTDIDLRLDDYGLTCTASVGAHVSTAPVRAQVSTAKISASVETAPVQEGRDDDVE